MHESVDPMTLRENLASRYQVSQRFLDKMMPMIEVICSDMEAQRSQLLELVEESVRRQAETESILFGASKKLDRLCDLNRGSGLVGPGKSRRQKSVRSKKRRQVKEVHAQKAV